MKALFIQRDPFVSLGLMYISAELKRRGHETDLIVSSVTNDIISEIAYAPDLIAISCTTGIHTWSLELADKIKKHVDTKIILGGSHPTFFPKVIEHPSVDMICVGDGEHAFGDLMDNMDRTDVPSLIIKKNGETYENQVANLVQDMDSFAFPDRELYGRYKFIVNQENLRIITMRGCPYACSFCFHHSIRKIYKDKGKYVRRRSIPNVIAEIQECVSKYNYKRVDFQDDTFTLDVNTWLKEFLVEYKKHVNLSFTCTVRPNGLDDELVMLMKKAGCHSVKMGFETADNAINNAILKRGVTNKMLADAMKLFKKHKIKVETFNLIGIPGESIEQALNTMKFNAKLGVDFARVALVQPYPKTDLEAYAKEQGYLDKDYDVDDYENSYFIATPVKLKNESQFINLQRLFSVGVRFPVLIPLVEKMIKMKPNKVFDTIFKMDYALSIKMLDQVSIKDFLNFGLRSKGFFSKKKKTSAKPSAS